MATPGDAQQRHESRIADDVEKLKAKLPQILVDASSKGKETVEIEKALSGHDRFVWNCGKGPSDSWFSHRHRRGCLMDRYQAIWDMLEAEGLDVSLDYRTRPNGVVGTYSITVKL